jgi:hypothetical protein
MSLTKRKAHLKFTGLPCEWKRLATAHLPTLHGTTSENLAAPEAPLQKEAQAETQRVELL